MILVEFHPVISQLTADCRRMDVVWPDKYFLAFAFLDFQIDCVFLFAGQLFIHKI